MRLHAALISVALCLTVTDAVADAAKVRQYKFTGECNGLRHWVSLLHDLKADHVTDIVVRAACPSGEPSVYRIHRAGKIPITMGGTFGSVIKYPGVNYLITGRIIDRKKATLRHKGPAKSLSCPGDPPLTARVCEKFELVVAP